jgi:hypothetical protein
LGGIGVEVHRLQIEISKCRVLTSALSASDARKAVSSMLGGEITRRAEGAQPSGVACFVVAIVLIP